MLSTTCRECLRALEPRHVVLDAEDGYDVDVDGGVAAFAIIRMPNDEWITCGSADDWDRLALGDDIEVFVASYIAVWFAPTSPHGRGLRAHGDAQATTTSNYVHFVASPIVDCATNNVVSETPCVYFIANAFPSSGLHPAHATHGARVAMHNAFDVDDATTTLGRVRHDDAVRIMEERIVALSRATQDIAGHMPRARLIIFSAKVQRLVGRADENVRRSVAWMGRHPSALEGTARDLLDNVAASHDDVEMREVEPNGLFALVEASPNVQAERRARHAAYGEIYVDGALNARQLPVARDVRNRWLTHRGVFVHAPTGWGKSYIVVRLVAWAARVDPDAQIVLITTKKPSATFKDAFEPVLREIQGVDDRVIQSINARVYVSSHDANPESLTSLSGAPAVDWDRLRFVFHDEVHLDYRTWNAWMHNNANTDETFRVTLTATPLTRSLYDTVRIARSSGIPLQRTEREAERFFEELADAIGSGELESPVQIAFRAWLRTWCIQPAREDIQTPIHTRVIVMRLDDTQLAIRDTIDNIADVAGNDAEGEDVDDDDVPRAMSRQRKRVLMGQSEVSPALLRNFLPDLEIPAHSPVISVIWPHIERVLLEPRSTIAVFVPSDIAASVKILFLELYWRIGNPNVIGFVDGHVRLAARDRLFERFNDDNDPLRLLVVTSRTSGIAIDMPRCKHAVFITTGWTSAEYVQCVGRLLRTSSPLFEPRRPIHVTTVILTGQVSTIASVRFVRSVLRHEYLGRRAGFDCALADLVGPLAQALAQHPVFKLPRSWTNSGQADRLKFLNDFSHHFGAALIDRLHALDPDAPRGNANDWIEVDPGILLRALRDILVDAQVGELGGAPPKFIWQRTGRNPQVQARRRGADADGDGNDDDGDGNDADGDGNDDDDINGEFQGERGDGDNNRDVDNNGDANDGAPRRPEYTMPTRDLCKLSASYCNAFLRALAPVHPSLPIILDDIAHAEEHFEAADADADVIAYSMVPKNVHSHLRTHLVFASNCSGHFGYGPGRCFAPATHVERENDAENRARGADRMLYGIHNEPRALAHFEARFGDLVRAGVEAEDAHGAVVEGRNVNTWTRFTEPRILAGTPDGITFSGIVVEVKCVLDFAEFEARLGVNRNHWRGLMAGSFQDIGTWYVDQVQALMACWNLPAAVVYIYHRSDAGEFAFPLLYFRDPSWWNEERRALFQNFVDMRLAQLNDAM